VRQIDGPRDKKNFLNSNICPTCPYNMVNVGPLTAETCWRVQGTPANFNGFRVLAALLHGTPVVESAKLCGVEQRAPPIFGTAAITLGIGPHSSIFSVVEASTCDIGYTDSTYTLITPLAAKSWQIGRCENLNVSRKRLPWSFIPRYIQICTEL